MTYAIKWPVEKKTATTETMPAVYAFTLQFDEAY